MLDPDFAFSTAGSLAMLAWCALVVALFVASLRHWVWRLTGLIVPGLLAIAYAVLLYQAWGTAPGGGFGSILAVRALFASDAALAAGWLHYLAFDLFVGTAISRRGIERGIHPLLLLPCLPLTFMFGPVGLLLFMAIDAAHTRITKGGRS